MAYTVKQLAIMSGVTVTSLRSRANSTPRSRSYSSFSSTLRPNPLAFVANRRALVLGEAQPLVSQLLPKHPISYNRYSVTWAIFSPGLGDTPAHYTAVLEDIASYGYIILAVNHTRFSSSTHFIDCRSIGSVPLWERGGDKLKEQFQIWVDDLGFTLRQLISSPPLAADLTRIAFFGHSYGGAAALAACEREPACRAVADWDGTPRGIDKDGHNPKPVLMLQSDHGQPDRDRGSLRYFAGLRTGCRMSIPGLRHHAFTDESVLPLSPQMRADLVGTVQPAQTVEMISRNTRAFFETYLSNFPGTCPQ